MHGPGVDDPIIWYEGSGTTDRRFLSADERGSIVSVTDNAGTLLGINRYDEYGQPQSSNTGVWGYTGQAWLPSMGVWYYKARMYDPELGRFLQTDPIGYDESMNLYAYTLNDPIGRLDPDGKRSLTIGERGMIEKYFGAFSGLLLDYIGLRESSFGFITRQFLELPGARSHIVPAGIMFTGSDYRHDYSKFDSIGGPIKDVFLHEFYHHLEIALGISTFAEMFADQAVAQITRDNIYTYDPSRSFLDNTPEARAQAFAQCVGGGICADVSGQRIPLDNGMFFTISRGGIAVYAVVVGSRIPQRIIVYPIKIK